MKSLSEKLGGFFRRPNKGPENQNIPAVPQEPVLAPDPEFERLILEAQRKTFEYRKQIEATTNVEVENLPENSEVDYESEADLLGSQVKAMTIYSKFHPGISIKGKVMVPKESEDYTDYGDKDVIPSSGPGNPGFLHPFNKVVNTLERWTDNDPVLHNIGNKHLLAILNSPDNENAVVSYAFKHDHRDRASRSSAATRINFLLGRDNAYRLLALIRQNPDMAEVFLQKVAAGFEVTGDKPGIRRIRADELVVFNLGRFNPDDFMFDFKATKSPYGASFITSERRDSLGSNILRELRSNDRGQMEILKYSRPFGLVPDSYIR